MATSHSEAFRRVFATAFPETGGHKRAWPEDDTDEERELAELSCKNESGLASKLAEIATRFSVLHMGRLHNGSETQFYGDSLWLKWHNPFACKTTSLAHKPCCAAKPSGRTVCIVYTVSFLWTLVLTLLQITHDTLLERPSGNLLLKLANSNYSCQLRSLNGSNTFAGHDDSLGNNRRTLEQIDYIIETLGGLNLSWPGIAALSYFLQLALYCAMLFSLFQTRNANIRLDGLSFVYKPLAERRRFKRQLVALISLLGKRALLCEEIDQTNANLGNQRQRHHKDLLEFEQALEQVEQRQLVKPECFKAASLRRIIMVQTIAAITIWILVLNNTYLFKAGIIVTEAWFRVKNRLELEHCKHSVGVGDDTNNLVQSQHRHLNLLDSDTDRLAYANYDGSYVSLIQLTIGEAMRTNRLWSFFLVRLPNTICTSLLFILHGHCYIVTSVGFVFSNIWFNQVGKQLDACVHLLAITRRAVQFEGYSSNSIGLHKQTNVALIASYINYELWRRHQIGFQKFINVLVSTTALVILGQLVFCGFVTFVNRIPSASAISIGIGNFLLITDVFLLLCAIMISRIVQANKDLTRMLAQSISSSMDDRLAVQMWRKQLVGSKDLSQLFAPKLLGLELSPSNLITLNVYLIGLATIISLQRKSAATDGSSHGRLF